MNMVEHGYGRKLKQIPASDSLPGLYACRGLNGRDFTACAGAQANRDIQNTPPRATNKCRSPQNIEDAIECMNADRFPPLEPGIVMPGSTKDICYSVDESQNVGGAGTCSSDQDCDGQRYCDHVFDPWHGVCTGPFRPQGTACPSKENAPSIEHYGDTNINGNTPPVQGLPDIVTGSTKTPVQLQHVQE